MEGLIIVENVPYRSPFGPIDQLKEYFTNKHVYDLGCGSGDVSVYILKKLNPKSIRGICIESERFAEQNKRYNMNFIGGDILKIDFQKEKVDTYFMWIESPDTEIEVIKRNLRSKKKCTIIVAYNVKANCSKNPNLEENYNSGCEFCRYLRCIQGKTEKLRRFLKSKNGTAFFEKDIQYNDGNNCRQNGIIKYFIINCP